MQGTGFQIHWQDTPLGQGEDRRDPTGAFIEDLILALIARVQFYQDSRFACPENEDTLDGLQQALQAQRARTANRERLNLEGT